MNSDFETSGMAFQMALDRARQAPRAIVSYRKSTDSWILFLAHAQFHFAAGTAHETPEAAAEIDRQLRAHMKVLEVRG